MDTKTPELTEAQAYHISIGSKERIYGFKRELPLLSDWIEHDPIGALFELPFKEIRDQSLSESLLKGTGTNKYLRNPQTWEKLEAYIRFAIHYYERNAGQVLLGWLINQTEDEDELIKVMELAIDIAEHEYAAFRDISKSVCSKLKDDDFPHLYWRIPRLHGFFRRHFSWLRTTGLDINNKIRIGEWEVVKRALLRMVEKCDTSLLEEVAQLNELMQFGNLPVNAEDDWLVPVRIRAEMGQISEVLQEAEELNQGILKNYADILRNKYDLKGQVLVHVNWQRRPSPGERIQIRVSLELDYDKDRIKLQEAWADQREEVVLIAESLRNVEPVALRWQPGLHTGFLDVGKEIEFSGVPYGGTNRFTLLLGHSLEFFGYLSTI